MRPISLPLLIIIIVLILSINPISAVDIEWNKTVDVKDGGEDVATCVADALNGFVISGCTIMYSQNYSGETKWRSKEYYSWLMKVDMNGNIQWIKDFPSKSFIIWKVWKSSDNEYVLASIVNKSLKIVKIDANGNILSDKKYDLNKGISNVVKFQTISDGFIVIYKKNSSCYVARLDVTGNVLWIREIKEGKISILFDIKQTTDGGFIAVGKCLKSSYDILLVKLDSNGNIIWRKTFGGSKDDKGTDVLVTDNGYIILGNTRSYGLGGYDVWLINVDTNGKEIWNKTFGSPKNDFASYIQRTSNGYLIGGDTHPVVSTIIQPINITKKKKESEYEWIIKIDDEGNKIWDLKLRCSDCGIISVKQISDNEYLAVGWIFTDKHEILVGNISGTYVWETVGKDVWLLKLKEVTESKKIPTVVKPTETQVKPTKTQPIPGFKAIIFSIGLIIAFIIKIKKLNIR